MFSFLTVRFRALGPSAPTGGRANLLPLAAGLDDRQGGARGNLGLQPIRAAGNQQRLTAHFKHTARVTLAQVGDFDRPQHAFVARVVRAAMNGATQPAAAPAARAIGRDPLTAARAQAAFDAVWSRLQGAIDDTARDVSLTRDQRAAAIRALRERQQKEAGAARKRVMDEERDAAKACRLMQPPEPRTPRR